MWRGRSFVKRLNKPTDLRAADDASLTSPSLAAPVSDECAGDTAAGLAAAPPTSWRRHLTDLAVECTSVAPPPSISTSIIASTWCLLCEKKRTQ